MKVRISRALLADIQRHAAGSAQEVCGLLFGTLERITAAAPAANVHPDPARFFELDPAALFAALRRARAGEAALIGHYHSHPGGRAEPSATDAAAADPSSGHLWLIVAGGEAGLFRVAPGGALHGMFDRVALDTD